MLTLAGHHESRLWEAWRESSPVADAPVGHLYVPELRASGLNERPIHMESTEVSLEWRSKEDIFSALNEDVARSGGSDYLASGRMIPWALNGCVFLPSLLTAGPPSLRVGAT